MFTPRSPGYDAARARLIAARCNVLDTRPRIKVRVPPRPRPDIILTRSLVMFAFGLALIALGILLDPPLRLMAAINPED